MKKVLLALVLGILLGCFIGVPVVAGAAPASFWSGTVPMTVTEALVVKSGTTVLDNVYVFAPVSLKTGETKVYTLTVTNTASTGSWNVTPSATSSSISVTTSWDVGVQSIGPGETKTYVLTLTAVSANPAVTVTVSFGKE